jgi:hypothetical protein
MTKYELKNIDPDDIDDLLLKVETIFDIKFVGDELFHIKTFGQLCEHVANKIQLDNSDDCTKQQAFYKLRDAISSTVQIDKNKISPYTTLKELFPRPIRRLQIKILEQHLGFGVNILRPPLWLSRTLFIILLASTIELFFYWQYGLLGIVFSIAGLLVVFKIGNELDLQTVGQVVEKMTRENYLKSRRNPRTFNKSEIEKVLTDWFCNDLNLDKSKLTRETKFT